MKVLITGGAGFIGSHLADRLLSQGDRVLVIDNFNTGRRDNLVARPNLEIVEGTIADRTLVEDAFERFRPEAVVHAAASYKDPEGWEEDVRTNALGTAHVVRAAERTGVGRLVYFQTALCYGGTPLEQPITLDHPIRPESSYAISKTAGEHYIALSRLDFVSLRLANVYGPRNLSGPLPTFFSRLTTGKRCYVADTRRDFVYVDDLLEVVHLAVAGKGKRGYYHVSSGSDFAIKELFDEAVEVLGIRLETPAEVRPREPGDVFSILLDPSKTNRDFGWKARMPLREGVRRAIEYYQEYGVTETYTHLRASAH